MRDPYLYEDADVLRNKLGITDTRELTAAEADITYVRLLDIDRHFTDRPFDFKRLCDIHAYIFRDIFDWAGNVRQIPMVKGERVLGGDTVRYTSPDDIEKTASKIITDMAAVEWELLSASDTAHAFSRFIAALWQVHPFREGNTRAVITFSTQFAQAYGFAMDKNLLRESAGYVRDALVKASDGQYSDYEYLRKILEDAILRG